MENEKTMNQSAGRSPRFLLLMRQDLRDALQESADKHSRTLTAEINERLRISLGGRGPTFQGILAREAGLVPTSQTLPASYTTQPGATKVNANDNGPAHTFSSIDQAMLDVFRALPPEKQLALLSLFR